MPRYYGRERDTKTLAIGIKGELSSFCGAIERFEHHGKQWNGLLTLKEQCARRIALIKNEQLKCFITAYLPPTLFKYVTKDIFNLQRYEFTSNYPEEFDLCDTCSTITRRKQRINCKCPNMKTAIRKLNKHFEKRMNKENKKGTNKLKRFDLIYKLPDDESGVWTDGEEPIYFFLYLSPCEDRCTFDTNIINDMDFSEFLSFQSYKLINGQASVEEKLLFVDVMRFFGGFQTDQEEPQLISCHRCSMQR
jgi:hypothetical protein